MERLTEGCNRRPPLYGPKAELYYIGDDQTAERFKNSFESHLNSVTPVYLRLVLVVFPNDTELDDTLRNLNDFESFSVFRALSQERLQAFSQFFEGL